MSSVKRVIPLSLPILAAFILLWWLLTAGDVVSWLVGLPTVLLAWLAYRHLRLRTVTASAPLVLTTLSWQGILRFIPFFLLESIRGGVDVAWRVWLLRIPVQPDFLVYSVHLPAGTARAVFLYTIGLLPGTLSVEMDDNGQLHIHALMADAAAQAGVVRLEQRIAAVFGLNVGESA